ncbi:MAG: transcriptional regulator [Planctomycetaceae bacterium]|nr:transcriptional regulator [Planctomycetaceae bacterium]
MSRANPTTTSAKVQALFKRHGATLRTSQAIKAGVHPRTLYALRDAGVLECLSRGLYRLANSPPLANPDLVTVSLRAPEGVVCLISALAFHQLTTQIPHEVQIALPRGAEPPRIAYPPTRTFWFTGKAFESGIKIHRLDGHSVRVYSPEKTLADCFKYRNKIGLDTAVEAIRLYKERRRVKVGDLTQYAEICRVTKVMRPYLEAIL